MASINSYLQQGIDLSPRQQEQFANATHFVGVDLAPMNTLESGLVVLNRDAEIIRSDKLYKSETILDVLLKLGPANRLVISLDMPKNFGIQSRFQQDEIKHHPLRLEPWTGQPPIDRFSFRSRQLFDALLEAGSLPFLGFTHRSKVILNLQIPFKARSPQGCRSLQAKIEQTLPISNLPSNLLPSSVLDATISAYTAWLTHDVEQHAQHFEWYADPEGRLTTLLKDNCLQNNVSDYATVPVDSLHDEVDDLRADLLPHD